MTSRANVRSIMVELHRFGEASSIIERNRPYIRTEGFDQPASQIAFGLDHAGFVTCLNKLRYRLDDLPAEVENARATLSAEAARVIPCFPVNGGELVQLDLVTGAAELWAFPFEACMRDGIPEFADPNRRIVLTRRIRGEFADQKFVPPSAPRVLFVHAPKGDDLEEDLIADHEKRLRSALRCWAGGNEPGEELLVVRQIDSLPELIEARNDPKKFTHIHLLAHGIAWRDKNTDALQWGLRLGWPGSDPVMPQDIAKALAPQDGLPEVITIAACDSANQSGSATPTFSLAQELHRCGVSVVVGSQFPLTKTGSVVLAEKFYEPVLSGEDVRVALFDTRLALHEQDSAGHDWLSLVSYVRLPEGYADRIVSQGVAMEMQMLRALQQQADFVIDHPRENELLDIERRLRERIVLIERRLQDLAGADVALRQECEGILASAHKRLAELYFRGRGIEAWRENHRQLSRDQLESALRHYTNGFAANIHNHWLGIQQLALEAVLYGKFRDAAKWPAVLFGAELNRATDVWALGTIAEVRFLERLADTRSAAETTGDAVRDCLRELKGRAKDNSPVESTRRQFARYIDWWTTDNGFFPACQDFRDEAKALVALLTNPDAKETS
jgi:hypothetical protein